MKGNCIIFCGNKYVKITLGKNVTYQETYPLFINLIPPEILKVYKCLYLSFYLPIKCWEKVSRNIFIDT